MDTDQTIPDWPQARGRVAALSRSRTPDDPDMVAARRDLRAARLAESIRRTVDALPALTDEQRAELARILQPARTGGAA